MKFQKTLGPPTPLQRVKNWAFNGTWEVFGDHLPGMSYRSVDAHEGGQITARVGISEEFEIGTWHLDGQDIVISISHEYPTSHG